MFVDLSSKAWRKTSNTDMSCRDLPRLKLLVQPLHRLSRITVQILGFTSHRKTWVFYYYSSLNQKKGFRPSRREKKLRNLEELVNLVQYNRSKNSYVVFWYSSTGGVVNELGTELLVFARCLPRIARRKASSFKGGKPVLCMSTTISY